MTALTDHERMDPYKFILQYLEAEGFPVKNNIKKISLDVTQLAYPRSSESDARDISTSLIFLGEGHGYVPTHLFFQLPAIMSLSCHIVAHEDLRNYTR